MQASRSVAAAAALLLATAAPAAPLFSDDFDAERGGVTVFNYNAFANFTVSDGTVDIVRSGDFGIACAGGAGQCVDLDGTSGDAGVLATTAAIGLPAGMYLLSLDLSGNQRGGASDVVTITLGSLFTTTLTLAPSDPVTRYSFAIDVAAPTSAVLAFANAGGDNFGAILDNVVLAEAPAAAVPVPPPLALLPLALAAMAARRRRR